MLIKFFFSIIIKYSPNNNVVINHLVKITEKIELLTSIFFTTSFTKVSLTAKDNCPAIINKIPNAPVENNILLFIVKKNRLVFSNSYG